MIHLEHQPVEISHRVPPGGETIILQNYEGEIKNCRFLSLMSNVLQGLHIKRWWLKAPLSCLQWCESLNSVMHVYMHPVKTEQEDSCSFQWGGKKKAFPEKADWVKHLGKISLPGTWMNQADWQRLPERELPMCHCIRRLSQAPPFTCLLSICYSFWNPFPLPASWTILASLPPCFPLLVYSRSPCPSLAAPSPSWIRTRFPFA